MLKGKNCKMLFIVADYLEELHVTGVQIIKKEEKRRKTKK